MSASIFISTTNVAPYNSLEDNELNTQIEINSINGSDVYEDEGYLYLVATSGTYTNVELRVENEMATGTSLYISPVDIVGFPTHWGKQISIGDIDASSTHQIIQIKYKWAVINNIFIIKSTVTSGMINIYGA